MNDTASSARLHVSDVIERYGHCLEIVPMDPNFHHISVGLYVQNDTFTVWTFSRMPGSQDRVEKIRDQLVALGGMEAVPGTPNQARFPCGHLHERPCKFLLNQAVGKAPDYAPAQGEMRIKDSKSALMLSVTGGMQDGRWVYHVSAQGEARNTAVRLRMIVAGFLRYGEMVKVGDTAVAFPCAQRHDELMRLLLPYSRNISSVDGMLAAEALRGQMTTGTLGFSPT